VSGVASFHLVREAPWRAPQVMARMAIDRARLAGVRGLRFWRVLGTGAGARTSFGIDPARTAVFAVWEDDDALTRFLESAPLARRWARTAERSGECWTTRLRLLSGHGRWRGADILDGLAPGEPGGPVAVLTRATVRPRAWVRFHGAGAGVSAAVSAAPGLLAVVAIGEAPLGRQATFSLWTDAAAVRAFACRDAAHAEVVRRTRAEDWYGEELFARFAPVESAGTWDGADPLAGRGAAGR
jgi:heme-degrading monooxygenase HmoA